MDERSLLLAQVSALLQQLFWAESSLKTDKIEPRISQAASIGFEVLFDRRRTELTNLQKSIPRNPPYAGSWEQLRRYRRSCGELFQECLGFLGGAMLRSVQENDICEIADALLVELSRKTSVVWSRVTILAEANFFTETTGLIRLPFPDYGIWNLPVAVHELGHFIGPRISDETGTSPFQTRLGSITEERDKSHLRELFADLFAVYALGPAYAFSCILLRFDPLDATACEDGETHPSHGKRVHFILKALEQTNGNPYRRIIKNLKVLWEWNLNRAGHEICVDPNQIPSLNYQLFELYPILTRFLSTVQYKGWRRAVELSRRFPLNGNAEEVLEDTDEISDVLNAAWLWRLQQNIENSNTLHEVNLQAIALCRGIIR